MDHNQPKNETVRRTSWTVSELPSLKLSDPGSWIVLEASVSFIASFAR